MDHKAVLGRNQLIGIGMTAVPMVFGFALVAMGKLDAARWLELAQNLTGIGVGGTLGGSALIKAIEAWRQ